MESATGVLERPLIKDPVAKPPAQEVTQREIETAGIGYFAAIASLYPNDPDKVADTILGHLKMAAAKSGSVLGPILSQTSERLATAATSTFSEEPEISEPTGARVPISAGELTLNPPGEIILNGKRIKLHPIEFKFLQALAKNPHAIISQKELIDQVWEANPTGADEAMIRSTSHRLRKKIGDTKKGDGSAGFQIIHGFADGFSLTSRLSPEKIASLTPKEASELHIIRRTVKLPDGEKQIFLDMGRNMVVLPNSPTAYIELTPIQTALLQELTRFPSKRCSKEQLFQAIRRTSKQEEYTTDDLSRDLSTHMHRLRKALEGNLLIYDEGYREFHQYSLIPFS